MALANTMRDADARTLTKSTEMSFDGVVKRFPTGTTALDGIDLKVGRGDFVGELALLDDRRRRADVTALGYCQLLVLSEDDFKSLLAMDPAIREAINRVAADRLKMNLQARKAG